MKRENFILETFLRLTSRTYPYKTEGELIDAMIKLRVFPKDIQEDKYGNYFYKIGESRTMFTAHLDTSGAEEKSVNHVFDGDLIKTDGKTILGADDKAGVTILLFMIKNKIPGLYYFFVGEEVGCIGSGLAAKNFKDRYDRVISFDRRDVGSVITYQSFTRCCSDIFANALAGQLNKNGLNYKIDESGIYTDSAEFTNIIPECTNISVGYYKEHTVNESQDIKHLEKLAISCLKIDWEKLPIKRDPSKTEYRTYTHKYNVTPVNYNRNNYRYHDNDYRSHGYGDGYNCNDDDWNWDNRDRVGVRNFKEDDSFKKSKKSKEYIDDGFGNLIPINKDVKVYGSNKDVKVYGSNKDKNYYECAADKILTGRLSTKDLEVIREQCLDMENDSDRSFYKYLLEITLD